MHKKKAHDRAFRQSGLSKNRAGEVRATRQIAAQGWARPARFDNHVDDQDCRGQVRPSQIQEVETT
jgi:hypothetical protein